MTREVLDAFALLAWMQDAHGAARVEELFAAAEGGRMELYVSAINLGEVFYRLARVGKGSDAEAFRRALRRRAFPFVTVPATNARVWDAATVKSRHAVSYADAFAVSLAREKEALIATGDPEILALAARGEVAVDDAFLPR